MNKFFGLLFFGVLCLCRNEAAIAQESAVVNAETEAGFTPLFDGKSFDGWKINESADSWTIEDGSIVSHGNVSHLFYVGQDKPFKNFHLKVDVMTTPGSNAGIYFNTRYQDKGWPKFGYECQVNVSHKDPKKTAGLYGVQDVFDPPAKDNQWYTQEIIVVDSKITSIVDGKTIVEYTEPAGKSASSESFERRLGDGGTFALQAHDPESKVYFKNIRVKRFD